MRKKHYTIDKTYILCMVHGKMGTRKKGTEKRAQEKGHK